MYYERDYTGRLVRIEKTCCCCLSVIAEEEYSTKCTNDHHTCIECINNYFLSECNNYKNYINDLENIPGSLEYFKISPCPLRQACSSNLNGMHFSFYDMIRNNQIKPNVSKKILKCKSLSDRIVSYDNGFSLGISVLQISNVI